MIELNQKYDRDLLLNFLKEVFLNDFQKDIRPVGSGNMSAISRASTLGTSPSLDLQVFEFEFSGSFNKRIALAKEAFQIMKLSATFQALAVFYSPESDDWRFSLMTANPQRNDKGNISVAFSNPRRYSFFLGPNAKVNTPNKFLLKKGMVVDSNDLKSRFSLEVVNKEFYKEISESFTKLVGGTRGEGRNKNTYESLLKLPSVIDHSQTSIEFAVRLIGRVIFCWFLKEKIGISGNPLMPKELLSLNAISDHKDYYHKILEPIFFEVLNKPIKSRRDLFSLEPFSSIPYLNGGLFSPHDDDFFSYRDEKQVINHNAVVVPDSWLIDFFRILETYNFTIDENTSIDEELSIDPEMLGRIFENLLAEINPETGESARKSTGSYYTPRVIVDYMVDESLLLYLKQKTGIKEDKLKAIISYDLSDDSSYPLDEDEKTKLVDAIERIKILDPACGSGAYPIGALQKIVFILQQIDPDGQFWFQKQIQHTSPEIKRVLEREFSHKNFDYIRKLGVIRENIYGIDIQPIATEIARLRCFLTLVVDERVDDTLENRGIEPLPNLDFKFVTANSLIGLPTSDKKNQMGLFEDIEGISELREIRDMFFNASGTEREQLKLQFVQSQNKMFQRLISENRRGHADLTTMLTTWDPFSHKASSWFDSEWMFGIKQGFNVVIGNPPYIQFQKLNLEIRDYLRKHQNYESQSDIWYFFVYKAFDLLAEEGILNLIVSNYFLDSAHAKTLRKFISNNFNIESLLDFKGAKVFDNASINSLVFHLRKSKDRLPSIAYINPSVKDQLRDGSMKKINIDLSNFSNGKWLIADVRESNLLKKLNSDVDLLCQISIIGTGVKTGDDKVFVVNKEKIELLKIEPDILRVWVKNSGIKKYYLEDSPSYVIYTDKNSDINLYPNARKYLEQNEEGLTKKWVTRGEETEYWRLYRARESLFKDNSYKLIVCPYKAPSNRFSVGENITGSGDIYVIKLYDETIVYYVLGILNSRLGNWINSKVGKKKGDLFEYYTEPLSVYPIKKPSEYFKDELTKQVVEVIKLVKSGDYLKNEDTVNKLKVLEKEIDANVYKLYGLTEEEIQIVESKK